MTRSYSEICTTTRALFANINATQMKSAEDVLTCWEHMLEAGMALTLGTFSKTPRFNKIDFGTCWPLIKDVLVPYEKHGCVEPLMEGRRTVGYVLVPERFSSALASKIAERKAKALRKVKVAPVTLPVEVKAKPEIRLVPTKPLRNKVEPSVAIIVDLANLTKHLHGGDGGKMILSPERMNWRAFRRHLSSCGDKSPKVDRAVLCVSEHYYNQHYMALRSAEQSGFTVVKMFGEKDADPVVMSQITKVVLDHLNLGYADRLPTIVLASGDKDFTPMIQALRPFVQHEGLSLSLHVATWNQALSRELYAVADKLIFIDDMLEAIDPFGSSLRRQKGLLLRRA